MSVLRWLGEVVDWIVNLILDGMKSGPRAGGADRVPDRDPSSGRWIAEEEAGEQDEPATIAEPRRPSGEGANV
jgi:hypothetical protein